jgi:hypothetical protein
MKSSAMDLYAMPAKARWLLFGMLLGSLVLNLIVAIGNWNIYARVEQLETIHGLRAIPRPQQKSKFLKSSKTPGSMSSVESAVSLLFRRALGVLRSQVFDKRPVIRPAISLNELPEAKVQSSQQPVPISEWCANPEVTCLCKRSASFAVNPLFVPSAFLDRKYRKHHKYS